MNLGKKVIPTPIAPAPEPEWKAYKPGIEINTKGELRTCNPLPKTPAQEFWDAFGIC